jgi:mannose-6-phosphate isomerase-like protein (cupin superfamily)
MKYQVCDCDPLEYCEHKRKEDMNEHNDYNSYGNGCACGLYKECKCSNQYDQAPDRNQPMIHKSVRRPWGEWHVLDVDQGYKVKRLEILPDQAISLQYHNHRSEHWTIVQGKGKVIVDGNIFTVKKGESFHVPRTALHKITNTHLTEKLIAIEVQMGEICSEDDIVRC